MPLDANHCTHLVVSLNEEVEYFLNQTTPSHLRIPLHLALLISPICLLANRLLFQSKCDRKSLLKVIRLDTNCWRSHY